MGALGFLPGRSSLPRVCGLELLVAPLGIHELAVIAEADVVAREIVPEKSSRGIVHVGQVVLQRVFVSILSLKIVGALLAAVGNRPDLFVVVGGDGGGRPEVAVAGNLSAIVKIVEHTELQRELVLVRRDVFAV